MTLIIAGDLFHENRRDFHEFEEIFGRQDFQLLNVVIIPGNHDANLRQSMFSLSRLRIIDHPQLARLEEGGLPFLFLPYKSGVSAGDLLASFREKIGPGDFVMVGHGDYLSGVLTPNPLERGVYMPLTRVDLDSYQPAQVFLGHTHLPFSINRVNSPGSPCAVDITETGRRGFYLYDPVANTLVKRNIQVGPIFMQEKFTVFPSDVDLNYLRQDIRQRIDDWKFTANELSRVHLLVKFSGCSHDRTSLRQIIFQILDGITIYPNNEPDLSDVLSEDDPALAAAVTMALQTVDGFTLSNPTVNPELSEIQRAVFRLVYGD